MTTPLLTFTNPGEIDPRLITLMGVNVKPASTNPIGYFGTGLKYAIATILRLGDKITIYSGQTTFSFFTQQEEIRGKAFDMIYMASDNDSVTQLAFTTELGKNWEPWMAYRELYCNAKDENGEVAVIPSGGGYSIKPGHTTIIVESEKLLDCHYNRQEFILESKPDIMGDTCAIHCQAGHAIFYRGLKVFSYHKPCLFTYDIQRRLNLTEDRTAHSYDVEHTVVRSIIEELQDEAMIEAIITAKTDTWEGQFYWERSDTPSEVFIKVATRVFNDKKALIHPGVCKLIAKYIPEEKPPEVKLSVLQAQMLDKAKGFLTRILGVEITQEIIIVETLGHDRIIGGVMGKTIYLPLVVFDKGTKVLAGTLLEEYLHVSRELLDESRDLQNWLIDRLMSLGEELQGSLL